MTTKQLIEKYEGYMASNPEFEPLLKEVISDLKEISFPNDPKVNLITEVEYIDPELFH